MKGKHQGNSNEKSQAPHRSSLPNSLSPTRSQVPGIRYISFCQQRCKYCRCKYTCLLTSSSAATAQDDARRDRVKPFASSASFASFAPTHLTIRTQVTVKEISDNSSKAPLTALQDLKQQAVQPFHRKCRARTHLSINTWPRDEVPRVN